MLAFGLSEDFQRLDEASVLVARVALGYLDPADVEELSTLLDAELPTPLDTKRRKSPQPAPCYSSSRQGRERTRRCHAA